jgi:hypothetical protein
MQNALLVVSNLTWLDLPTEFANLREIAADRNQWRAVLPWWVQKLTRKYQMSKWNEQRKIKILIVRKERCLTITTKIPVFDCTVALCTMKNVLLVISKLTWLLFNSRIVAQMGGLRRPALALGGASWMLTLSSTFSTRHWREKAALNGLFQWHPFLRLLV